MKGNITQVGLVVTIVACIIACVVISYTDGSDEIKGKLISTISSIITGCFALLHHRDN